MAGFGGSGYQSAGFRVPTPAPVPAPSRYGGQTQAPAPPLGIPARTQPTRSPARAAPPPRAATATSPNLTATAAADPRLEGLSDRYTQHLDALQGRIKSGVAPERAAQLIGDVREGSGRRLKERAALFGRASDPSIAAHEGETARLQMGAIADVSAAETAMYGGEVRGGLGVAGAPGARQLDEKRFGLSASAEARAGQSDEWSREIDKVNREAADSARAFDEWRALLELSRESPMYMG